MIIRRKTPLCDATNTVDGRPCRNTARGCPIAAHKTPDLLAFAEKPSEARQAEESGA